MNPHRAEYIARLMRVVEYIDAHLAEPLPLETLAAVAHLSPFHFHRLFTAMTGETLADCIRRRRLEAAATLLLNQPRKSVLAIAINTGFASAEVFSRNFSRHFGCGANEWRRGTWRNKSEQHMAQLREIRQQLRKNRHATTVAGGDHLLMNSSLSPGSASARTARTRTLPAQRVAYLRHVGPYSPEIGATWKRLWAWCDLHGLRAHNGLAFGLVLDNPHVTEPAKCRYDACVAVAETFKPEGAISMQSIPAGRFGCSEFAGTPEEITDAWNWLYGEWLPDSGHELGEGRLMEIYRVDEPSDRPEGEFRCELCLPLAPGRS